MSWLSSVKGFVFGAPKITDNIFDKDKGLLTQVGGWVDKQQLTDQERLQFDKEMGQAIRDFSIATMGENTERSQTRRRLAEMWYQMHVFFIKLTFLSVLIDHLAIKAGSQTQYELFAVLFKFTLNPWLCSITAGIGAFFWGSHALRSSKWAKEDK